MAIPVVAAAAVFAAGIVITPPTGGLGGQTVNTSGVQCKEATNATVQNGTTTYATLFSCTGVQVQAGKTYTVLVANLPWTAAVTGGNIQTRVLSSGTVVVSPYSVPNTGSGTLTRGYQWTSTVTGTRTIVLQGRADQIGKGWRFLASPVSLVVGL
jgi:hypothetical protein